MFQNVYSSPLWPEARGSLGCVHLELMTLGHVSTAALVPTELSASISRDSLSLQVLVAAVGPGTSVLRWVCRRVLVFRSTFSCVVESDHFQTPYMPDWSGFPL